MNATNFNLSLQNIMPLWEHDDLLVNSENMIMSDSEMKRKVETGEASTAIITPKSTVENSGLLRQMKDGTVYVKYEDPRANTPEEQTKWVIYRTKDHTNGKAYTP